MAKKEDLAVLEWVNRYVFGTAVPILLIMAGIFYGFRLKWFHLRRPRAVLGALLKRETEGGVSSFRALTLALAGTLGVGNIVGVSAALWMGGFGAIFWMWVSAFFAMLLKYAEIVLAMRHRRYDRAGKPHGSAMLYIKDCLEARGHPLLGAVLAAVFALLCILNAVTMGSVIQVNAVVGAFEGVFGISPLITGSVLALLIALILRRGREGILRLTGRMVPLMTLGYLLLSVAVLILRADRIPDAFSLILRHAFEPDAAVGGIGGFVLSSGVRYGTMRGLISNEAGCGTAPAAHAVSDCHEPARQGMWGIFEVFADTILLCTVTALVVIVSWGEIVARSGDFMMMTISAYEAALGPAAAVFMSIAVLFFGFATVVCWAHYGTESAAYLSDRPWSRRVFLGVYVLSVFAGAFASSDWIWQTADFAVGAMTLINGIVICAMSREVQSETERWLGKR
ncbi:MAG: sodium:alanine symporter family protein [Clostridia bacterium]|nr:sodium:alanine symporter family protein [Clostridia bacterium]